MLNTWGPLNMNDSVRSGIVSLDLLVAQNEAKRIEVEQLKAALLKGGGGGGTSGGMEARVNRLEDRLDKLSEKVGAVEVNLATLTERVAHLPSKGFIVGVLLTSLSALGALVLFADQLKGLFGIKS